MSGSLIPRVRLTDAFEAMMTAALEIPVGTVNAPPNVYDAAGKVRVAHAVIFPIPSASGEPSLTDPWEVVALEYQVTYVGTTRKQAEWLADAGRAAVVGRNAGGGWTHSLTPSIGYVVDRSVALFGAVSSEAPGAYTVSDSFYLVVT